MYLFMYLFNYLFFTWFSLAYILSLHCAVLVYIRFPYKSSPYTRFPNVNI